VISSSVAIDGQHPAQHLDYKHQKYGVLTMDPNEFQEAFRILTSGSDSDVIEKELVQMFINQGMPEKVGQQLARVFLEGLNDPQLFAQKIAQMLPALMAEAGGDDVPPWMSMFMARGAEYMTLASQARQLFDAGRYGEALQVAIAGSDTSRDLAREMQKIAEDEKFELGDELHQLLAQGDGLVGFLQFKLGNFAQAVPMLDRAIAFFSRVGKTQDITYIKLLQARAMIYYTFGDSATAVKLIEQAIGARDSLIRWLSGEDHAMAEMVEATDLDMAALRGNLGLLYGTLGDFNRAWELHMKARQAWSWMFESQKNAPQATPEAIRAVGVEFALQSQNCGGVLIAMGHLEESRTMLLQTAAFYEGMGLTMHPDSVQCLANLAELYRMDGETETATRYLMIVLDRYSKVEDQDLRSVAKYLEQAAVLCATDGRFDQALSYMAQSADFYDALVLRVLPAAAEQQRLSFMQDIRGPFVRCLSLISRHLPASPDAIKVGFNLVLRRKGLLAEAALMQREVLLQNKYEALAPQLNRLLDVKTRIANKTLTGYDEEGEAVHRAILAELATEQEQLEIELSGQIPDLLLQKHLFSVNAEEVAILLPAGSALIEFVRINEFDFNAVPTRGESLWRQDRYLAFVLHAGRPEDVGLIDLGEATQIDKLVDLWRSAITGAARSVADRTDAGMEENDRRRAVLQGTRHLGGRSQPKSAADGRTAGDQLRKAVFDPLGPALSDCRRLFIAPDGEILKLPFEALPSQDQGYLLDDFAISYLGSGRDLLRLELTASATNLTEPAIIIADPDYDLGDSGEAGFRRSFPFDRLIGTREEGEQLSNLLKANLYIGIGAVERCLKKSDLPAVLHIATHGFFQEDTIVDPDHGTLPFSYVGRGNVNRLSRLTEIFNPMLRSGLALAGANIWAQSGSLPPEAEDGLLTAEDVSALNLRQRVGGSLCLRYRPR